MTRPTDCTTSTWELRGVRNRTASSAGTSTPSDRQRTLERMRQVFSGRPSGAFSHCSLLSFSPAFMPPSTCSAWQVIVSCGGSFKSGLCLSRAVRSACWYSSITAWNISAISLELTLCLLPLYSFSITWQKATARRMGLYSAPSSLFKPYLDRAFQQPTILAASSTLSSLLPSVSTFGIWRWMWLSSIANTMTL